MTHQCSTPLPKPPQIDDVSFKDRNMILIEATLHTDTDLDTQRDTHRQTHTDTHKHTDTHRHGHRHTHTDTDTQRHTQADTHTDTHTHIHTNTQTHTHKLLSPPLWSQALLCAVTTPSPWPHCLIKAARPAVTPTFQHPLVSDAAGQPAVSVPPQGRLRRRPSAGRPAARPPCQWTP